MLLRLFKGRGPGVIFLLVITLLVVWASAFLKLQDNFSLYFDLDPMPLYGILSDIIGTRPLPGIIFTLAIVILLAFSLVYLNNNLFFINERTFLPALIYVLLSGLFPQFQLLNPAIFAAIFLILAIGRIMDTYRIPGTAYSFFDAGILIGTGSLFYASLIWFGLLIIIGVALLRTWNLREIALSLFGLVTPYVMTFGVYYISGKDMRDLMFLLEYNLFGKIALYAFTAPTITALIFIGVVILMALVYLLNSMNSKKIRSRKIFYLFLWVLIISISIFLIFSAVSVEIIWLAGIPVSYLLAHYFVFVKKRLLAEFLFTGFFIIIILIQIFYMSG